ncbi:ATP-binding protein [Streptomyces sp. V2]|nr:ATP-binding protein [Streptomyces sp. V2]
MQESPPPALQGETTSGVLRAIAVALEPDPQAAARARRTALDTLTSWGLHSLADDLTLIVSELVANAAQHGEGTIVMVLRQRGDVVLVEVADASPGLPVTCVQSDESESGRGLALVEALSDDWGCRARARRSGKWVWCSRSLSSRAAAHVGRPASLEAVP